MNTQNYNPTFPTKLPFPLHAASTGPLSRVARSHPVVLPALTTLSGSVTKRSAEDVQVLRLFDYRLSSRTSPTTSLSSLSESTPSTPTNSYFLRPVAVDDPFDLESRQYAADEPSISMPRITSPLGSPSSQTSIEPKHPLRDGFTVPRPAPLEPPFSYVQAFAVDSAASPFLPFASALSPYVEILRLPTSVPMSPIPPFASLAGDDTALSNADVDGDALIETDAIMENEESPVAEQPRVIPSRISKNKSQLRKPSARARARNGTLGCTKRTADGKERRSKYPPELEAIVDGIFKDFCETERIDFEFPELDHQPRLKRKKQTEVFELVKPLVCAHPEFQKSRQPVGLKFYAMSHWGYLSKPAVERLEAQLAALPGPPTSEKPLQTPAVEKRKQSACRKATKDQLD